MPDKEVKQPEELMITSTLPGFPGGSPPPSRSARGEHGLAVDGFAVTPEAQEPEHGRDHDGHHAPAGGEPVAAGASLGVPGFRKASTRVTMISENMDRNTPEGFLELEAVLQLRLGHVDHEAGGMNSRLGHAVWQVLVTPDVALNCCLTLEAGEGYEWHVVQDILPDRL